MRAALPTLLLSSLALAPTTEAQHGPSTAAPTTRTQEPDAWTLSFNVQGAYESNVGYGAPTSDVENVGDFLSRAYVTLERRFTGSRSRFGLSLDGGGAVYRDFTDLNNATWGAQARAGYDFTRRTSGDVAVGSSLAYLRDFAVFDPTNATSTLAPYTLTRYDNASASLRYLTNPRTTLHIEFRGRRYAFQEATLLTGGKDLVLSSGVDFRYGSGSRLSGVAEYERTSYGPAFEIARSSLRWARLFARGWTYDFEAGAAAYRGIDVTAVPGSVDPNELRFGPILRASVDGAHRRHQITLSASRNVGQTYGFGTVGLITTVGASYTFGPFHDFWFVATADASRASGTPVDVPPDGLRVGSTLRWQAARRLRFTLDSSHWSRHGGTPLANTSTWTGWSVTLSMVSWLTWR